MLAETALRRIPFSVSLKSLHPETYDAWLKEARRLDKESILAPTGVEEKEPEIISSGKNFFATGGLVEGKDDVPYTKENPADRVDPNTGKPYSDQMARLGLAEGGGDMTRVDGTKKSSQGWLGPIKNNVTGQIMTEVSMGIGPEDKQKLIPLLVPTLNKKEIEILQNMKIEGNIKNIPQSIKDKAVQHAKQREVEGLNVFYE